MKSIFAAALALSLGGLSASAAEVGTSYTHGTSTRNVYGGHQSSTVRETGSSSRDYAGFGVDVTGDSFSFGGGLRGNGNQLNVNGSISIDGVIERGGSDATFDVTSTRSNEFSGTDYNTFTTNSTFTN